MMENNYCVYMHKLETEEWTKRYIGITCTKPKQRWGNNGKGYKDQSYFWNAIEKYGWDNFKHIILFEGLSKEEACLKEVALIKLFNTQDRSLGFNITEGGDRPNMTKEIREKIGRAHIKFYISRKELYYHYITLNETVKQCAKHFCCSPTLIYKKLKQYNINKDHPTEFSKEELYYHYIVLDKSIRELAVYFEISIVTVRKQLQKYDIKKDVFVDIQKEELENLYIDKNMTIDELAEYFKCGATTIKRNLKKYGIRKTL